MSLDGPNVPPNPLDPQESLEVQPHSAEIEDVHPASTPQDEGSATTKAEKFERHPYENGLISEGPPAKKARWESAQEARPPGARGRRKGEAPIISEYYYRLFSFCVD